jgi:hypothetical protein
MRARDFGPPHCLISVDLGVAPDRTAISVMEMHGVRPKVALHVRALSRPMPGAKVAAIVEETRALYDELGRHLARQYPAWVAPQAPLGYRTVLLDLTGAGQPALALFDHARIRAIPIWLTGGIGFQPDARGYRVAKADLISALALSVEDGRLKVADGLPEAPNVLRQFQTFQRKTPLGTQDQLAVWRERPEDDVILSFAMGCWYAQYGYNVSSQRVLGL